MNAASQHILEFASGRETFTAGDIVISSEGLTRKYIDWTLLQLVKEGKIARVSRGCYKLSDKSSFKYLPDEGTKKLYGILKEKFPLAPFCVYKGEIFSPLQHHLSYNTLTYIETDKWVAEACFHSLSELGQTVWYKPSKKVFYDYIDISKPAIIVKPLTTGSPLLDSDGIKVPALEKILVDIRRDPDFDYLSGQEASNMLENAFQIFNINRSTLLRYAGRRGIREQMEQEILELTK